MWRRLSPSSLLIVFIAILTLTGLLGRRLGEAALILAAIAFMASRMIAHWRLRGAQKNSLANAAALHEAGETRLVGRRAGAALRKCCGIAS